mmetsp:Transcript_12725/g.15795  ORF Transcript_12725/g.15795 Transcript_12725/m.15795 type:complete len:274 (-) Transcript_12725:1171-1992(-)|eukprot:CAMPEP_0204838470 /NCGR_PEP_ID=MMETSP1346-20131115/31081_1 /ASSEMBLY_ACC=CAM_ASM_000771 /TAXON_ID=215587 /ORGANISM="Aplanochytrium stocchinoi, Strain GSBS06" /LENGTH=273 /DNA_ID=CAMNT_0051974575 /DNA_START=207 /DNA_END=1028 /DNA_ORIENTATION=+
MHRNVRRIILVRHGESVGNVDATVYGKMPDNIQELTSWGKEQAVRAGRRLKGIIGREDVRFVISPYKRSHETFHRMAEALNEKQYSYIEDPRLREQDWGNFQDLESMAQQQKERRRFGVFYYRFEEGESGADVYDRVSSFMETLHRDSERAQPKNYVLISHGITIRMFLARYYHWPVDTLNKLHNFYNGQMVVMEKTNVKNCQKFHIHRPTSSIQADGDKDNVMIDQDQYSQGHSRFLLTSLLMSDPPGPPEDDIWWEKIEERRKTTSPLLGL